MTAESQTGAMPISFSQDLELARAAADGLESARRMVLLRLLHPLRRTISYLVGGDEPAEDLTQVTLVKVLSGIGSFRGECALEHWAKRIAVRVVTKYFEKRGRRLRLWERFRPEPPVVPATDEQVDEQLIRARIARLLHKMSPDKRTALVLHLIEGYTSAEVAEMTGAPLGTTKDRLLRGRTQLRRQLQKDPVIQDWFKTRKQ